MRVKVLLGTCVSMLACLISSSSALATVTQSHLTVTSPSGRYIVDNRVGSGGMSIPNDLTNISVSGTSDGTTGDHVDVACFFTNTAVLLTDSQPVNADGTFAVSVPLGPISGNECVLRAVPAGSNAPQPPNQPSSFTGPTLNIGAHESDLNATAPNTGKLEDFFVYGSQVDGGFDYHSQGFCGLYDSFVYDPLTLQSVDLDYCNGGLTPDNGNTPSGLPTPGEPAATRSELRVGGKDAYLPGGASLFADIFGVTGAEGHTGFPSLSYSYSLDPTTGAVVIQETDQVVECAPSAGTYPPTSTSCSRFVPAGVAVHARWVQGHAGRVTSEVQSFTSTDGHPHSVDLLEMNEFFHPNHDGELDFPWTSKGMTPYATGGQKISGPSRRGPGSFFVKGSASVPDGGEGAAQGAVTFSSSPSYERILRPTNGTANSSRLELHYARLVPAKGSVSLGFTYSVAFRMSEVRADARAAEPTFLPSVAISKPKGGSKSKGTPVTVSGTAHDAYGLAGVTVNGVKAKLSSKGTWTAKVKLHLGSNKLTAVAANIFGNTATATRKVSFPLTLTSLKQSHSSWKESAGTTFSFVLNAAARVTFNFTHKGKKAGSISVKAKAGHDSRSFDGKLSNGKKLKPGSYSATVSAKAGKAKTKARTLHFTITG